MNAFHSDSPSADVRAHVANRIGFLELNRPQALNALSTDMIRALHRALDAWRDDADVLAVVIHSPHPRAFCAGGDVRFFHDAHRRGDQASIDTFFIEEYALNHAIFTYPKPYIALMHGVVMGGGMGISQAARRTGGLRVVTDSTKMAMPETRIGLFPDVGMSWFLARTPGALGRYLAVTGATLDAASALYAGLADAYLPDAALPALLDALRTERLDDGAAVTARVAAEAARHASTPAPDGSALASRARRSIGISRSPTSPRLPRRSTPSATTRCAPHGPTRRATRCAAARCRRCRWRCRSRSSSARAARRWPTACGATSI
ncbi:enoyl-CoA hydratase/isomerase family protein [Burkholderia pseudomallei MSHR1000]|nr:enoyl-CoA hydratase/isomerase family protein [Burkholderia pseudomallei MSHR1000]